MGGHLGDLSRLDCALLRRVFSLCKADGKCTLTLQLLRKLEPGFQHEYGPTTIRVVEGVTFLVCEPALLRPAQRALTPRLSLVVEQGLLKFVFRQDSHHLFSAVVAPRKFPFLRCSELSALRFVTRVFQPGHRTSKEVVSLELSKKRDSVLRALTLTFGGGVWCDHPGCSAVCAGDRGVALSCGWQYEATLNRDLCPLHALSISCDYLGCDVVCAEGRSVALLDGWQCDPARNTDYCPVHVPSTSSCLCCNAVGAGGRGVARAYGRQYDPNSNFNLCPLHHQHARTTSTSGLWDIPRVRCDVPGCHAVCDETRAVAQLFGWQWDAVRNVDLCPLHRAPAAEAAAAVACDPHLPLSQPATAPAAPLQQEMAPTLQRSPTTTDRSDCSRKWTREAATMQRLDRCASCSSADHDCLVCEPCRNSCHASHQVEDCRGGSLMMGFCACATLATCLKYYSYLCVCNAT